MKATYPSRSTYGDGSIYQRKDGRWAAKYFPAPGASPKYIYGQTRAEVTRKLNSFRKSPEVIMRTSPSSTTLVEYVSYWLKLYKKPAIKPATYDRLESILRNQITPAFEYSILGNLTSDDYQKFISDLTCSGASYAVVKKSYDLLRSCLEHAVKKGDITSNPMNAVIPPARSKYAFKEAHALSPEEEKALFEELFSEFSTGKPKYSYRDAFVVMINTGLREGEMVALDWSDINFNTKKMHVWKTAIIVKDRDKDGNLVGGCHQEVQHTPKTKTGNRTISLNKAATEALRRLREQYPKSQSVLTTETGVRPLVSALQKQVKRAAERCGLKNVSPHTLRHTFASKLLRKKADVKSVSALLGHSSVAVTWNIYYHLLEHQNEDTVALLDEM